MRDDPTGEVARAADRARAARIRARWPFAGAVALTLIAGGSPPRPAHADDPRPARTFDADFRGKPFDAKALSLQGEYAGDLVKLQPDGLRITIPPGLGKPDPTGVSPNFRVRGDFDISAEFEVVRPIQPGDGYGIGVQIHVETLTSDAATIGWNYQPGPAGMTFTSSHITGPSDRRRYARQTKPARARSGTLRLTRRESTVTSSFRDGPNAKEVVLRQIELGKDDITKVLLTAHTGWSSHPIDARLLGLSIAADSLPGYGEEAAKPGSGRLPLLLGASVAALSVGGLAIAAAGRSARRHQRGPGR